MVGNNATKGPVDNTRKKDPENSDLRISELEKDNFALKEKLRSKNEEFLEYMVERGRDEEAIKKSRFILAKSQEIAHVGNWAWNMQTGEMNGSDEAYRIYGYSPGEVRPDEGWALARVHPDDKALAERFTDAVRRGGARRNADYRIVRPDGAIRHVAMIADKAVHDRAGNIKWVYGIVQDVTERKLAEEEAARLASIVTSSDDAIIGKTLDGIITSWNKGAERLYGYTAAEALGKHIDVIVPPDRQQELRDIIGRIRKGERVDHHETVRLARDGQRIDVSVTISPMIDMAGRIAGASTTARNITERKRADEALREKQEELEIQAEELRVNNEELEKQIEERMRVEETLQEKQEELEAQAEELESQTEELRANNEELEEQITERRRVEEALRETSNYLESLINHANAPIIVWGPDSRITRFNHAFERLTGYTSAEVVGKDLGILFPRESKEEALAKIQRTLAGERWETVEIPILRRDGKTRIALWNSANIYSEDGNTLVATIAQGNDITERKRAEEELIDAKSQAELYLDLMGHDISNMHQIAMSQLELAREVMAEEGRLEGEDKELIDTPVETLERSARLIDNVRKLQKLRAGEYRAEAVDLGAVLADVVREHSSIPDKKVAINYSAVKRHYVRANPLLKDVFTNLVGNAIKHSGDSATISIIVDKVAEGEAYYRVAIEDYGPGIPDEKKEEVFHRFKRGQTKARGTGLGLYIVRTLVEGFNGRVEVEDRVPGDHTQGTRFLVYLPALEG